MALSNLIDETPEGMQHVRKRLARRWFGIEHYEVNRVTFVQGHADFGVVFESSDTRSVPCAWINNDDRCFFWIDAIVPTIIANFRNPQQRII